jgi:outer membrane protein assembly complex protein YaeT
LPNLSRLALAAIVIGLLALASGLATPAAPQPIVTAVNVRGNSHVPTDRIAAVIRTQTGVPLDNKRVAADQQAIMALGYFTDVKTDLHATPGGVAVSFIVIENPVVSKLVFNGNKQVSGDVLLALMDTTIGTVLNTNTLRDDIQKINSYYDKLGFIGTRHVQDIKIDANGTINIAIKEGVTVTDVVVSGNHVFPTPVIKAVMKTKPGVTFSGQQFNDDLNAIQNLYKDAGLSAVLDGAPDVDHPGVVNVTICEATVGAIEIAGNSITKDYVIRRLLRLHPGSLVSDAGLRQDYEAINNTQFFKSVDLGTKPFGSKCGYITLVWTVVEQRTGTAGVNLSYGGGGQYGQGFGVGISFAQNNVAGTGDSASINLQKGQHFSNVNFSVGVPYIQKFKSNSVSFSIFNNLQNDQPRPVYKIPGNNPFYSTTPVTSSVTTPTLNTLLGTTTVTSGPCQANGQPCTNQFANFTSRNSGVAVTFGHPVATYTRLSFGLTATQLFQEVSAAGFPEAFLSLGSANISPGTAGASQTQNGSTTLRSFIPAIFKDNRDDIANPRHGGTSGFSEEISLPAFGSDYDFGKGDYDWTHFWPVKRHSTLALHFNYGFSSGGPTALPYNDLFSLSDQQLRGTKYIYYGNRELLAQAELRVPVTSDKKFGLAFFADAGDAPYINPVLGATPPPTPTPPAGPHAPFFTPAPGLVTYVNAPYVFERDIGVGIRVQTPLLPQVIRVDFAVGNQGSHTSFGIGQSF